MKKLKLLYVDTPFIGFKGGDKNRSNFLYESLNKSFKVDILLVENKTYKTEEILRHKKRELYVLKSKASSFFEPNAILGFEKKEQEKFMDILKKASYDIVFFRFCTFSNLALKVKEVCAFTKVIVDVDMLFSRINKEAFNNNRSFKNRYYLKELIKTRFFEKRFLKQKFTFLYTNEEEIKLVKDEYSIKSENHLHIPNIIKDVKAKDDDLFSEKSVLFFGALDSTANISAYKYLINEIYPLIKTELIKNKVKIKIVGKNPTNIYKNPPENIDLIGEVDDINSYIKSSHFVFLPIKVASGTRTRILEALNLQKVVLCTFIASEGLNLDDKIFVEDNKVKLANKFIELIKQDNVDSLQEKAYEFVKQRYLDTSVAKDLEQIVINAKKELNIVHIPRRFSIKSWGGTENVIVSHLKNFKDFNIKCEIYTSTILDNKKDEVLYNTKVKRFDYFYPYFNLSKEAKNKLDLIGGNIFSFSMFFALLFKKDLDLVHLHTAKRFGSIARTVCKLRKIPYIITIHGGVYANNSNNSNSKDLTKNSFEWGKILGFIFGSREVYKDANAIICLNKKEYEKMLLINKNSYLLPNSIDINAFKNNFKKEKEDFTFLVSARIDKQKNQLLVLKALKDLKQNNIKIIFAGNITDENYFKELEMFIKKYDLKNLVQFKTNLKPNSQELKELYFTSNALILPSIHEPFGIVVLEAWASKLPVITSDVVGISDYIVHQINALTFQNNNEKSLAFNMNELINDQSLQEQLKNSAYKSVQEFDDKVVTSKVVEIYTKSFFI